MLALSGSNGGGICPIPTLIPPLGTGRRGAVFVVNFFHVNAFLAGKIY